MSDNLRGALLMMATMAAFTFNDACIKATGGAVPLGQLLFLRGLLASALVMLIVWRMGVFDTRLPARDWRLIALRTGAEIGTNYFFLTALLHMPIANVTAVIQVAPLTLTLGSALFFRESVGWRRMAAIVVGFCGMLLIVRPGADGFSLYALYAIIAVLFLTLRDLTTRRISSQVPSMMVTLSASIGVMLFFGATSLFTPWAPVSAGNMTLIFGASVLVVGGYVFSVMVMRIGDVSFVSPFRYTGLLWALLLGLVAFGNWPDGITLLGAAIVVASGVFTLIREGRSRVLAK